MYMTLWCFLASTLIPFSNFSGTTWHVLVMFSIINLPWSDPQNTSSDHLSWIIKQLMNSIIKRLCENLVNEQVLNTIKPEYYNALHNSGYKSSLKYPEEIHHYNSKKRTRNIISFNPQFSQTVKTNLVKSFLRLLDKHFLKSHSL